MATVTTLPILRLGIFDVMSQELFGLVDLSSYAVIPQVSGVALQITPPDGWPTINVPFNPGQVNIFNCSNLGISCLVVNCCPLPDGIYSVVYTVNPASPSSTSITKTFIKIDQLQCRFMNAFLKVDLECDCEDKEKRKYKDELREIDMLINGSVAAANDCNDLLSVNLYQEASCLIDKIYSKFCLYCGPVPSCRDCQ